MRIFFIFLGIIFASISTYFITNILTKYILSYSKMFEKGKILFLLFYTGLLSVILPLITSINLSLLKENTLAYYNLLYNNLLDSTITAGFLILIFSKGKILIDKNIVCLSALTLLFHLFLILKRKLDIFDSILLFAIFIIFSIILIKKEYKRKNIEKERSLNFRSFLIKFFFILIALFIFFSAGTILSNFAILLKSIFKSNLTSAYLLNLIANTLPTFLLSFFIYKYKNEIETGFLPIIGQSFYTFTIFSGIIFGINPVFIEIIDFFYIIIFLLIIFQFFLIMLLFSLNYKISRYVGIFLIFLGLLVSIISI